MIKKENGKPKIYWGDLKIAIPSLEILLREEIATLDARLSKIERKIKQLNQKGVLKS